MQGESRLLQTIGALASYSSGSQCRRISLLCDDSLHPIEARMSFASCVSHASISSACAVSHRDRVAEPRDHHRAVAAAVTSSQLLRRPCVAGKDLTNAGSARICAKDRRGNSSHEVCHEGQPSALCLAILASRLHPGVTHSLSPRTWTIARYSLGT